MKQSAFFSFCLALPLGLGAQNQPPLIQQLNVTPDWNSLTLTVQYEVQDPENDPLEITLQFSDNGGKTYALTGAIPVSGDVGFPVASGLRSIQCDISTIANTAAPFRVRLVADDKQTFDIQSLVDQVDSNRLRADLVFVEGIRHRTAGLAHLTAVRDSMGRLFQENDLYFHEHTFAYGNYTGRNVIGTLPGTSAAEKVVVNDAHYDSVANAPGADDNGSGTVGVMEAARLLSRYPFKKSVRFIGFDLEESGLIGSSRYVSNGIPTGEQIEGVFNYEMIGYWSDQPNTQTLPTGFSFLFPAASAQVEANQYRGDFISNVGNAFSQQLELLFTNSAQQYVPDLKVITLEVPGNGEIAPDLRRSDHTPFWEAGKQALMLTDGANFRNECYHTPGDTLNEKLNFKFMSDVVKATIAAMAQLAEIQHGDWATASFQSNVGIPPAPDLCQVYAVQHPDHRDEIDLQVQFCAYSEARLELYDMKGALVFNTSIELPGEGIYPVLLPSITSGAYVLKIRHAGGTEAQKLFLAGTR